MKRTMLIAAALMLLTTTANAAAPKLPEIFRGQWCGESPMERCAADEGGIRITANSFGADDFGCRLVRLTPPSRVDREYQATFQCIGGGTKPTSYRRYYWLGFDHDRLIMVEANSTFTKEQSK